MPARRSRPGGLSVAVAAGVGALVLAGAALEGWGGIRVTFEADDGVRLEGTLYEPAFRSRGAVVLVHMLTRDRHDWDRVGERLAIRGIAAFAFDLRGHGESGGARPGDPAEYTRDVSAALRYLDEHPEVSAGRLGVAGASLGANVGVTVAAGRENVVSLALLSPSLDYRGLRIEAAMRRYGPRPALLVSSIEDAYASRSVRSLAEIGPGTREIVSLDYAGHGAVMLVRRPDLVDTLVDWFSRTLL